MTDSLRESIARKLWEIGNARIGDREWEPVAEVYRSEADALLAPDGPVGRLVAEADSALTAYQESMQHNARKYGEVVAENERLQRRLAVVERSCDVLSDFINKADGERDAALDALAALGRDET